MLYKGHRYNQMSHVISKLLYEESTITKIWYSYILNSTLLEYTESSNSGFQ